MEFSQLTYEIEGPVALIGLNRPAKRNAINDTLIGELQLAVTRAGQEARVGILFGYGEHFSAGLDLAEHVERTPVQSSGGTIGTCGGVLSLDWNAYVAANPGALGTPFVGGETCYAQGWFRDPPSPKTTNLSNALQFAVHP